MNIVDIHKHIFTDEFTKVISFLTQKVSEEEVQEFIEKFQKSFTDDRVSVTILAFSFMLDDIFSNHNSPKAMLLACKELSDIMNNKLDPSYS